MNLFKNNHRYSIGIDPDVKQSGYAVYDRLERKLVTITSLTVAELFDQLNQVQRGTAHFYLDAGWLNEGFHHYAGMPQNFEQLPLRARYAYMVSCGVKVGRNFGVGQLIAAYLKAHGHEVIEVQPKGGKAGTKLKWDAATLLNLTGWRGRTNEDARDAARLCFGR